MKFKIGDHIKCNCEIACRIKGYVMGVSKDSYLVVTWKERVGNTKYEDESILFKHAVSPNPYKNGQLSSGGNI